MTITTVRECDKIIVEIWNFEIGMFKEQQKNIFIPQMEFFLKERTKNKGQGIGLLLVKDLLQKNGSKIWVENMQSVASSFNFTVPIYNYYDDEI
ncbi:ATP-binding protein [Flavobacterium sp. DSR3-2]|uniref:ATP-binding protein n=1 Tax=Flavobacterium sp. DSR3-2 TaxID=2804634 RepID=UPI003CE7FA07